MKLVSSCVALGVVVAACGGAPTQVSFVSNEQPGRAGERLDPSAAEAHNEHATGALPADESIVEPEHPLVETKQERALVHIHAPDGGVCSGAILGQRFVVTAQHCVKGEPKGANEIAANREYRVEIASSGMTWTSRRAKWAIVPDCDTDELDAAVLVLAEKVAWAEPLTVAGAPAEGAHLQALGFGHCSGETRPAKNRIGVVKRRSSEEVVLDLPLCAGDAGGPVVTGAEVVGLISHRDDPEGSPLRTTAITRLDTRGARRLLRQATQLAASEDMSKSKLVKCGGQADPTGEPK
jgi:hypothetical protein